MKLRLSDVRAFLKRADMLLFVLCLAASIMGLVEIYSATATMSSSLVYVQLSAMLIGIALFFLFTVIDADIIADQWPLLLVTELLLLLLLIPFGMSGNTINKGWIRFGPVGIQPSEIVKIIYIVLSAKHIAYLKEYRNLSSPLSVLQLVAHFGILFVLILLVSSDLGSALVFFFIFAVMVFIAGVKLYWFLFGGAAMAVVIPLAWNHVLSNDQKARILAPYVPDLVDETGYGITWEPNLAKMALSSGRLTGTGLLNGPQTQSSGIESKHADYIFACIGEEMGMVGCLICIALLTAIMIRCVYVGLHCHSTFGMLVCMGMAAMICFQMLNSVGMCTGLTPVIGLTLPFFSYGGSSMFSTFAAMGIVSGIHFRPKPSQFRTYSSEF